MSNQVRALLSTRDGIFIPLNSTAAYSLRLLNASYTGPVVQVRRSNDNSLNTFTAVQVTDGTLTSWVGANNNGFVTTWYDQANNLYHAVQTTGTAQPQIVQNGNLILQNSRPTINYASLSWLTVSNLGVVPQPITIVVAFKRNSSTEPDTLFDTLNAGTGKQFALYVDSAASFAWKLSCQAAVSLNGLSTLNNTSMNLFTTIINGGSSAIYGNSINSVMGNAGINSIENLIIGSPRLGLALSEDAYYQPYRLNGSVSEFYLYNSNQTQNRLTIEAEINSYYNIF